jgi:hypothetical protein
MIGFGSPLSEKILFGMFDFSSFFVPWMNHFGFFSGLKMLYVSSFYSNLRRELTEVRGNNFESKVS